jgi:hypothetical protein
LTPPAGADLICIKSALSVLDIDPAGEEVYTTDMAITCQDLQQELMTTAIDLEAKTKECEVLQQETSYMKKKGEQKQKELKRTRAREDYFRMKLSKIDNGGKARVQKHEDRTAQQLRIEGREYYFEAEDNRVGISE